jgi:hypothetical protein
VSFEKTITKEKLPAGKPCDEVLSNTLYIVEDTRHNTPSS